MTLDQIARIVAAQPLHLPAGNGVISGAEITTDSRAVSPGQVFLALRGEKFDGHEFVEQALAAGAIAAIVETGFQGHEQWPLLKVPDTLAAYQAIGRWWRQQFQIPVIAITGSVGKTTTKELIAAVLGHYGQVLKTKANYNNEIGVPKTLLELTEVQDYAVIEMGMRGLGEIALLCQIAQPDIAVITNVGTAHIERLGSEAAIAQAKCELLAEMPATGVAILNHDNPLLLEMAGRVWSGRTITFGLTGGDVQGQLSEDGRSIRVGDHTFVLPLPGKHNALNYLAALVVAQVLHLDWSPLTGGLTVQLPAGRAQRYELPDDILILDETYNAGLESMTAALHLLAQTPGQRHIAVLGTMRELGDYSVQYHRQVGQVVQQLNLDHLLILAQEPEATALTVGAGNVPAQVLPTHEAMAEWLKDWVQPGDRLLFKASRAVELDRVVAQLRAALQRH